jgi:outer membrane protein insertion porin family
MKRLVFALLLISLVAIEATATDKAIVKWARTGPRIKSILIEGNQYFSDEQIRKHLYSRPRTVWLAIKGDRRSRVQRETFQRDTLEVKYLYLSNGFLNVRIQHSYQPALPDSSAIVHLQIEEGPRYLFGITSLSGSYDRQYHVRLSEFVSRLERGAPANLFLLKETESTIKTFLSNRGYPYARIGYTIDTTGRADSCNVTFTVEADSLVHFGNVTVEVANPKADGRARYPEYASLRELEIVPGGLYRRDDLLESQRRLFESGYFTTFQLSRSETSFDRLNPDFRLRLTERKSTYLTFRIGAAQAGVRDLEWDLSAGAGQRNVWGSRTIEGTATLSFSAGKDVRLLDNRFTMRFVEPWFVNTRTRFTLSTEYQPRITDPRTLRFDKESWSVSTVFSRWFGRKMRANLGLEYQHVKLSDIPDWEIPIIKEQEGISARRKIYVTIRRDSRDDVFIPQGGSVTEFSGDFYGGFLGGDADFFKLQASWSRYRRVWPGWVAASRLKGGWAEEFGNTRAVPLDEALYLGGANTIRGVKENSLGPRDADGNPVGARYIAIFNQEFRWKTVQFLTVLPFMGDFMNRFPLWQSVFVDIGNGFRSTDEMRFDNLAVAYGFGFQITSPAGPIRIDYAELVKHHDFDYSHRWHFTILYAF